MRKRSEAVAMRKRSEATETKPSAAERTEPLPVSGTGACNKCETIFELKNATRRPDGKFECPECGAPAAPRTASDVKDVPSPTPSPKTPPAASQAQQKASSKEPQRQEGSGITSESGVELPRAYCNECGAEWLRTAIDPRPFPNCGHKDGFVYDPTKAKNYKPPAGHAQMNEPQRAAAAALAPTLPQPTAVVQGNRLHVSWGKSVFPLVQYGTMAVGDVDVWIELPSDPKTADEVARVALAGLEKLATEAFERQLTWYLAKLGIIEKKMG